MYVMTSAAVPPRMQITLMTSPVNPSRAMNRAPATIRTERLD
jgi:hypothetical protein